MTNSNEAVTITVEAPLLRPGLRLTVGPLSKRYTAQAVLDLLEIVREINACREENK